MLQLQWSMHSSSVTLSTFTADIVPQVNARRLRSFVTDNRSFWGYLKTKQSMLEFNNVALFGEKLDEMRAIVDDQVEQIDSYEQEVVEERDDLDGSDEDDMCGTGGILSADERAVNQTCKTLVETIGKLLKKVKHRIVDETIDKENPSHIIFLDTLWYDHIRKLMESGDELVDALDAPHDMLFITAETRRFTEIAVDVAGRCKELALPKHHVWFDMCVKRMLSLLTAVQDHAPER